MSEQHAESLIEAMNEMLQHPYTEHDRRASHGLMMKDQAQAQLHALTHAGGLVALYGLQQWEAFAPRYAHNPLPASYFLRHAQEFVSGLENTTRKTALKHIDLRHCVVCAAAIDLQHSVLDHIIPLAEGGPDSLQNALLLCRRCNSSKGTKDLLVWWMVKKYDPHALPRTVLCLYARMVWQFYGKYQPCAATIPSAMHGFLAVRALTLPTGSHRLALYSAALRCCDMLIQTREEALPS